MNQCKANEFVYCGHSLTFTTESDRREAKLTRTVYFQDGTSQEEAEYGEFCDHDNPRYVWQVHYFEKGCAVDDIANIQAKFLKSNGTAQSVTVASEKIKRVMTHEYYYKNKLVMTLKSATYFKGTPKIINKKWNGVF